MVKFREMARIRAMEYLWKDIRLIGCMSDDEMYNGSTALRARRLLPVPKLYAGTPDKVERFCKELHQAINASRAHRNQPLLPGNGWNEWEKGREYVLGPDRTLINSEGKRK